MNVWPRQAAFAAILLLLARGVPAQEAPPTEVAPAPPTSPATLVLNGEASPFAFATTPSGALFPLAPLATRLGARLDNDAIGQSYTLTIAGTSVVLGAGSPAATIGTEIIGLSQPTLVSPQDGLLVPLDLFEKTFGTIQGVEFSWQPAAAKLLANQRSNREIPASVDIVHLQGVSTLVLQFAEPPRYRVEQHEGSADVVFLGDRIKPANAHPAIDDPLVKSVELAPERVHLALAAGTSAQSYTLKNPFRVVFDVYKQAAQAPTAQVVAPPRRSPGIQTIVIDPGHGGSETGAISAKGTQEKELTLLLAQALKTRLEARLPVRAVLTRTEDAQLPLTTRSALANQFKADLFISIHLNSSNGHGGQGAETYFLAMQASDEHAAHAAETENATPPAADASAGASGAEASADALYDLQLILWDLAQSRHLAESQRFANLVQAELNQTLALKDRGVKQAPFRVLMGAAMPAVLVELGFINNPEEESKLLQPAYRAQLAEALVDAVARYRSSPAPQAGTAAPAGDAHR